MRLTVPLAGAVATVSDGATLAKSAAGKGGTTEFRVVGLASDFQLAWRKSSPSSAEAPVVLEAVGSVLARLDGRRVSTEATLSVRSYSGAFDRFVVRLPPETELLPANGDKSNGYVVTKLPCGAGVSPARAAGTPAPQPTAKAAAQLVEVRWPKKTTGPVEVRLNCRRDYRPSKTASWCELSGFEVVGAARQWGTVAVAADGDWQVLFGPAKETRPLDPLPEALRKEDVIAGLEYFSQPYSLPVRLTPRKSRVARRAGVRVAGRPGSGSAGGQAEVHDSRREGVGTGSGDAGLGVG